MSTIWQAHPKEGQNADAECVLCCLKQNIITSVEVKAPEHLLKCSLWGGREDWRCSSSPDTLPPDKLFGLADSWDYQGAAGGGPLLGWGPRGEQGCHLL